MPKQKKESGCQGRKRRLREDEERIKQRRLMEVFLKKSKTDENGDADEPADEEVVEMYVGGRKEDEKEKKEVHSERQEVVEKMKEEERKKLGEMFQKEEVGATKNESSH